LDKPVFKAEGMEIQSRKFFFHVEPFSRCRVPLPGVFGLPEKYTVNERKLWVKFSAERRGIFGREEKVPQAFLILPGLPRHPWRKN
jgi:hypothetical protein